MFRKSSRPDGLDQVLGREHGQAAKRAAGAFRGAGSAMTVVQKSNP